MNLRRVNTADGDSLLDQEGRQGFAIAAGRLQTDVGWRERAPPGEERLEPSGGSGEACGLLRAVHPSGDVNFGFGDVDPDGGDRR